MTDSLTITGLQSTVEAAAHQAIRDAMLGSGSQIKVQVNRMVDQVITGNELVIKAAVSRALEKVISDEAMIESMVREALLASSDAMQGQFIAVMKRVGKDLALDRQTLERLVEAVRLEIAQNAEKLGIGMFS
jgi:hypothetical protein